MIIKTTNYLYMLLAASLAIMFLYGCGCRSKVLIDNMRCEYTVGSSFIGIDTQSPRFTWTYDAKESESEFRQGSFRLYIASDKAMLSDTTTSQQSLKGKVSNTSTLRSWVSPVITSANSFVEYEGTEALAPETRYYWMIAAWDESGNKEVTSPIDSFETAKIDPSKWSASWISDKHDKSFAPAPMLRRAFALKSTPVRARIYVSAAAYYKMALNGASVTKNRLDPAYTHYDKRNIYAIHDVTDMITEGENVLTAVLGNGFYNEDAPVATWSFENARWRNRPRMICELHIDYADGTSDIINSDSQWRTTTGAYVQNNIYSGDTYDARLEQKGWDKSGFDDSKWDYALQVEAPSQLLVAQTTPAIRATQRIAPIGMRSFGDTTYVYDFGVNISGVCHLDVQGESGTKITMMHGELIKDNGLVEMRNIDIYYKPLPGLAFQTDTYILNGEGEESFTPDFNYHGFRYVEVKSDRPIKLTHENLTALFMHTAVEPVGTFACSDELMNKIWDATNRAYLSNLTSIPTDCPQREKNGWTADAHIAIDLALLNYDGVLFYEKWLDDFVDNQNAEGRISGIIPSSGWGYDDWIGPVWDAAMFIIPRALYDYYGDTRSIEKMYPVCEKYLAYLASREDSDGCVTYGIGDWVPYKTQTPTEFTSSCYYYLDNKLMAQFATLTGRDASPYQKKADELRQTINRKYFDEKSALYSNGSQAAQGVALYLGIAPQEHAQRVADNLHEMIKATDYHLDFGTLGSKTVLRVLCDYGYADAAYRMASQKDEPSWGGWINRGYTTLAETWVISPEFRDASINHVFLGDISAWMYNALAGINFDPEQPGFSHILLKPHFVEGLNWVKAEYRSVKGAIRSEWRRKGDHVIMNVTIPVNTTATLTAEGKQMELTSGKHEIKF